MENSPIESQMSKYTYVPKYIRVGLQVQMEKAIFDVKMLFTHIVKLKTNPTFKWLNC